MPNPQPSDMGSPARKRYYYRHYLINLMKAAVAMEKHPDQVVGTAIQHFLGR